MGEEDAVRSKLAQLEIDALRSQAADLLAEIDEYDRLRSGGVSAFEAASSPASATSPPRSTSPSPNASLRGPDAA